MTEPRSYEGGDGGPPRPGGWRQGGGAGGQDRMGLGALAAGIVSIVLALPVFPIAILLGIAAIVLGVMARRRAGAGRTGVGMPTIGIVLGALGLVLGGLVAAFVVTNADEFEDLAECLEEADDEAARDACEEEFDERIGAPAPVRSGG